MAFGGSKKGRFLQVMHPTTAELAEMGLTPSDFPVGASVAPSAPPSAEDILKTLLASEVGALVLAAKVDGDSEPAKKLGIPDGMPLSDALAGGGWLEKLEKREKPVP